MDGEEIAGIEGDRRILVVVFERAVVEVDPDIPSLVRTISGFSTSPILRNGVR
jgi:hypothetical protein